MSVQVEKLEQSMAKLTIESTPEEFESAMQKAYLVQKNRIVIPGFRKGKAPRNMIEKLYGPEIFYEEAINALIPEAYEKAATESELVIVSRPDIDVTQVEKGKPMIFTATVAIRPEVTLGQYKGLEVEKKNHVITDTDIDAKIDEVREQNARIITIEDRPVQDKDIVLIDYTGYVDGEKFEGGEAKDYTLTIGSHTFIDTFETQLIGSNINDKVEVNVTFPDDYSSENLKGKKAKFDVLVKEIRYKELPEADDDFASDVSDFDTIDEYRESIANELKEKAEKEAKAALENDLVDKVIEGATMDIAPAMIDDQTRNYVMNYSENFNMRGIKFEQYLSILGQTVESFTEQSKPMIKKRIEARLVLESIAEAENIEISDEEFNESVRKSAEEYGMEPDKFNEYLSETERKNMKMDLSVHKAIDLIVENANITTVVV